MKATIEKLIYGGEGIAHESTEAIFVPFVLGGEQAEIQIVERTKKFARGRVTRLLSASPDRVEPPCPHFGICGGCDYQHANYEQQLKIKEAILRDTLKRIGRIEWPGPVAVHASAPWQYRNRAQWKIRPAPAHGAETMGSGSAIGYFRARSSTLCPIETCPVISPKLLETFTILREALASGDLPSSLSEIEAFASNDDNELLLNIMCASPARLREQLLQKFATLIPAARSILVQDSSTGQMSLHGPGFIHYSALQRTFRIAHLSFFQVNRFLLEELAATVARLAGTGELAFDLYAGVGLFSVLLAGKFSRVLAVESNPVAARDLEINAAQAPTSLPNLLVHSRTTEAFLQHHRRDRNAATPDAIVLDPPRAGIEHGVAGLLADFRPRRIVYVSCDPATLARDLANTCLQEYTLREIHLFDMFAQTYHIESAAFLERAA